MNNFNQFLLTILISLIVIVICTWPVQLLWNWLMPLIFGLPKITLVQAFGVMFLSNILFKNNKVEKKNS